ncbi:hypothetical protein Pfo_010287 [Paulownia fortunei]|nr:hypothetical protein Pfo_010287 [Paulownia fortunei]
MSQIPVLSLICVLILQLSSTIANDLSLETYIVHVDLPYSQLLSDQSQDLESWYRSFLPTAIASSIETPRMVYSYRSVFSGFAAKLTSEEVKAMENKYGFISARPQEILPLHTTHTPNFLGLYQNMGFWNDSNYGKGIVIGVLDTGILPDHPSFSDEGMPPPPAKWKGPCEFNFTGGCNNKLIGARHFRNGDGTPLDFDGHGTHTAGTAAGNFVRGANLFGMANGTAVGIAPLAHLAIYKVCSVSCSESDILAAMDAAIEDGVDVLSISLGGSSKPFHDDNIALGAFSAMERGIFVSASAGNSGPSNLTLSNEAPWMLTVGASTTDRKLMATAVLGNKQELNGESAFQPKDFPTTQLPLVYPGLNASDFSSPYCSERSLNNTGVQGKIVLCYVGGGSTTSVEKGQAVKDAGGAAMILINTKREGYSTSADAHVIPATNVNYEDGLKILAYINSSSSPTASIVFKGTTIGDKNSPMVAYFSSRGPSRSSPGILKPDIIGPGVNILAAWPTSVENNTNTKNNFNVISGTSMSCPHLSGVAALIKSAHPDWSPAAIKSAIMTTAYNMNLGNQPIQDESHLPADIFATGAGHVNPARANDPGLIYDIVPQDYVPYLCGLNYTNREIFTVLQRWVNCSAESRIPEGQLNYPSFSIRFGSSNQTFTRTVTNVGEASSSYTVEVVSPRGIDVIVKPRTINFSELNQKLTYEVTFSRSVNGGNTVSQGYIIWKSAKHSVRSPIVVFEADIFNLFCVLILHLSSANANDFSLETYIVHVDIPDSQLQSEQSHDLESWYHSFLPTTIASSTETPRMVYSYRNVFSGFAAKLTSEEVKAMQEKKGFISARPQQVLPLHTTHTPNFLGLHENMGLWKDSNYGRGIVIGVLDTGIFPDHPSFRDEGMPPPPAKWKGRCEFNFTACNNKLIGARHFKTGDGTPLDHEGHGTHAASTAAGNFVRGANIFGNANGTAVGVAPLAHLAIYKVCSLGCSESDILAAMDAAIEDGVDVISISFGGFTRPFHEDNIALGAFTATQRGIFVSCSAGNSGPFYFTLSNEAPWILTVGASTIDRNLRATAVLGNEIEVNGESAFQPKSLPLEQLPLVYPGMNSSDSAAIYCHPESLNNTGVKGKIVLCNVDSGTSTKIEQGRIVKDAGGAAMILINMEHEGFSTSADAHVIPATNINYEDGLKILAYMNSTSTPTATIVFRGTIIGDRKAPMVAAFSSRGPSFVSRGILKPDIIGPGVNILAAWPNSVENKTNTRNTFNVISGTSVSCPHLSGVAALIKSVHPDWSPAAIKSAIMTTADTVNHENQPIPDEKHRPADIFASGAGHVNPARASDPGLIYDIEPQDYIPYLCGLNYTNREVSKVFLRRVNCSEGSIILEGQLNYPSFEVRFGQSNLRFTRTVTNVGQASSSYSVEVVNPQGFDVVVNPRTLNFTELNQKLTYEVSFSRSRNAANTSISQGYILWKSAKYSVRSPIAAFEF